MFTKKRKVEVKAVSGYVKCPYCEKLSKIDPLTNDRCKHMLWKNSDGVACFAKTGKL